MDAIARIELYNQLFYVSAVIAVVGFLLAVFFFFLFDIPGIIAMMTGKARKQTIREMEAESARSGSIRFQYPKAHTEGIGRKGKTGRTGKTGHTKRSSGIPETAPPPKSSDFPAQKPPERRPETVVLNTPAPDTAVLAQNAQDTVPLQVAAARAADSGKTEILTQSVVGFRFQMTENTMVIHTDEMI